MRSGLYALIQILLLVCFSLKARRFALVHLLVQLIGRLRLILIRVHTYLLNPLSDLDRRGLRRTGTIFAAYVAHSAFEG
jgi:Na+/phosphate symporter